MDACPHWAPRPGPASEEEFLRIARVDGVIGLAAVAVSVASAPAGARWAVVGGVAGAALLDIDKPCVHFFGFNPFPGWCRSLHVRVQREAPHRLPHEVIAALVLAATIPPALARRAPRRRS
jgi:hypothetical protein